MRRRARLRARRRIAESTSVRLLTLGIGAGRVGIGLAAWVAPGPSLRFLGFDPENPQARALCRLAGARDLVLGLLAVGSLGEPGAMRAMSLAGASVDAADAGAFGIALVRREEIDHAALMGVASASAASAAGFWLADRLG